ncbi:MAG TPA: dihydrofolate reductase [Verrucomicrobiota bacterium]|nr:dihydrofolate reductase [Verrucomicrobiota bacterium]
MNYLKAIAAMSENRVIGKDGRVPWHFSEELKWFKKTTMGHVVLMGRKTFESIGKPLPGRTNVVLSRSGFSAPAGVVVVKSIEEALEKFKEQSIFICGGAQVYSIALPLCSELFITHIKGVFEGDAFLPSFESDFVEKEVIQEGVNYKIVRYTRLERNLENMSEPQSVPQLRFNDVSGGINFC